MYGQGCSQEMVVILEPWVFAGRHQAVAWNSRGRSAQQVRPFLQLDVYNLHLAQPFALSYSAFSFSTPQNLIKPIEFSPDIMWCAASQTETVRYTGSQALLLVGR